MRNEKITPLYERLSRDEEAAEMVRRIFSLTMEGYGPYQISKLLSEAKVEIPGVARFDFLNSEEVRRPLRTFCKVSIPFSAYLVHTLSLSIDFGKHFKDKKSHYVDESEWTIFENTHEAIIDQETFDNVQRIRANVQRYPDGWGEDHPSDNPLFRAAAARCMSIVSITASVTHSLFAASTASTLSAPFAPHSTASGPRPS